MLKKECIHTTIPFMLVHTPPVDMKKFESTIQN